MSFIYHYINSHVHALRCEIAAAAKRASCKAACFAAAATLTLAFATSAEAQTTPTVAITPGDAVTLKYKSVTDEYNPSQTNIVGSASQLSATLTADGKDVTDQYTISYSISGTGATLNNGLLTATGAGTSTVTMTATPKDAAAYSAVTREITVSSSELEAGTKIKYSIILPQAELIVYKPNLNDGTNFSPQVPTFIDEYGNVLPSQYYNWPNPNAVCYTYSISDKQPDNLNVNIWNPVNGNSGSVAGTCNINIHPAVYYDSNNTGSNGFANLYGDCSDATYKFTVKERDENPALPRITLTLAKDTQMVYKGDFFIPLQPVFKDENGDVVDLGNVAMNYSYTIVKQEPEDMGANIWGPKNGKTANSGVCQIRLNVQGVNADYFLENNTVDYLLYVRPRDIKIILNPDPSTIAIASGETFNYTNRFHVTGKFTDVSDDNMDQSHNYVDESNDLAYGVEYWENGVHHDGFYYQMIIPAEYIDNGDIVIENHSREEIEITNADGTTTRAYKYGTTEKFGNDNVWNMTFYKGGTYHIYYEVDPWNKAVYEPGTVQPFNFYVDKLPLTLEDTNWGDHATFIRWNGHTVDVNTVRTLAAGADKYNTYCLPFDVARATLNEKLGEGYDLMQLSSAEYDGSKLTLNFTTTSEGIKAGMPYLISKLKENVVNPAFADALIKLPAAEEDSTSTIPYDGGTITFYGTAFPTEIPNNDRNVIFTTTSGVLKYTASRSNIHHGNATLKGQRGYFIIHPSEGPSGAKPALAMAFRKPDITEVKSVEYRVDGKKVPAYNIEGQRVGEGYRGIVIRGGKKYLQK